MLKMVLQLSSALNSRIADLTDLCWVELIPLSMVELEVELIYELGMNEVQKCISHVTVILNYKESTL